MCGIAGFITLPGALEAGEGLSCLRRMTDAIAHRGPDADGHWVLPEDGIYLGHRRLSILDLSEAGAQPMRSHCGRYIMIFNGEIYNFASLLKILHQTGHKFDLRGHSDTEILLEGFARIGVPKTLEIIKGMFAIALWDTQEKTLTLLRDHVGKKPLYYGFFDNKFVFSSELKAIMALSKKLPSINRQAMSQYNFFGFIPEPLSIFENLWKLPPAHMVTFDSKAPDNFKNETIRYYNIFKPAYDNQRSLDDILKEAVGQRMISDVPLGAFLSGGIDSSLVTAIMQSISDKPVKTYAIGFEGIYDESSHAEQVALHLGTDHKTYHVGEGEALQIVSDLAQIYDEPFADYSQIPTAILCQKARQDTIVALSGDGGDEFFCGYKRYFMLEKLWGSLGKFPYPLRKAISGALRLLSQGTYDKIGQNGKRIHTVANIISAHNIKEAALKMLSVNTADSIPDGIIFDMPPGKFGDLETMMQIDTSLYLSGDILCKVDRASMFSSLEVRSPLLDRDVIAKAWSIGIEDKIFHGNQRGKKPLYDLLCQYVPAEIINRPKQGFTPPIAGWLKGPMKDWAVEMLFADTDLYDGHKVRSMWDDFISGKADYHYALWTIIMAQSWHTKYYS